MFRGSAIVAALLATVQPVLGSFAFFRGGDPVAYETIHLVVGGILYNVAILLAVLLVLLYRAGGGVSAPRLASASARRRWRSSSEPARRARRRDR